MSPKKLSRAFYSRRFFLFNLVLVGVILGFVLAVALFSCSTSLQPGDTATADEVSNQDAAISRLRSLEDSFHTVAEDVLPSVVKVEVVEVRTAPLPDAEVPWFDFFFPSPDEESPQFRDFRTEGVGSGVVVRKDGNRYYVLTNDHVIGEADEIRVTLDDGRNYEGELVGKDARKDLALISFDAPGTTIPEARLGDSDRLRVGDWVVAIGTPFGFQSTVTAGIVSALGRRGGPQNNISDFIQTDAAINQGNSGGALVNLDGEIVGINTWITSQTGGSVGLGFSIPINNARRAIGEFIDAGTVRYGWLGVQLAIVTDEIREALGLGELRGAMVENVFVSSPAWNAGFYPGDVIIEVDGQSVRSNDELIAFVGELLVGTDAVFTVWRSGETFFLEARIRARADEQTIAEQNRRLWPGMYLFPLSNEIRDRTGLDRSTQGAVVAAVGQGTPADEAGVRVGDVLTSIGEVPITGLGDAFSKLGNRSVSAFELYVIRDGQELVLLLDR